MPDIKRDSMALLSKNSFYLSHCCLHGMHFQIIISSSSLHGLGCLNIRLIGDCDCGCGCMDASNKMQSFEWLILTRFFLIWNRVNVYAFFEVSFVNN